MLTTRKVIAVSPQSHGPQPAIYAVCCRYPTISAKSSSKSMHLSSAATHG
jgi:hypothetical protein